MKRCLSTLKPLDEEGFSPAARRRLADRRAFPARVDFTRADLIEIRTRTVDRMSISGVQEKVSLRLERGKLTPVAEGGQYILKPAPSQTLPRFEQDVPANEHLTMQLAEQLCGIDTAANACIRLADGALAYIARRFDRTPEGSRIAQEDFCQLMNKSPQTAGKHYKYDSSYQQLAESLRQYCPAYAVESEKLFRRIVFNYLVANGDAHLKNFSIYQLEEFGDYVLTPAYDLLSTKLHLPNDTRLALRLFAGDEYPEGVETHGFCTGADFIELGTRMGLSDPRATTIVEELCGRRDEMADLVERSFLSDEAKQQYHDILADRRKALEIR